MRSASALSAVVSLVLMMRRWSSLAETAARWMMLVWTTARRARLDWNKILPKRLGSRRKTTAKNFGLQKNLSLSEYDEIQSDEQFLAHCRHHNTNYRDVIRG